MLLRTLCGLAFIIVIDSISCLENLPLLTVSELQKSLLNGADGVYCVVLKNQGAKHTLEDAVSEVRYDVKLHGIILGTLDLQDAQSKYTQVKHNATLPVLRCFMGPAFITDYQGAHDVGKIAKWIRQMKKKYLRQWKDNITTINSSALHHNLTILALPSLESAQAVDGVVMEVERKLSKTCSVNSISIHPHSKHKSVIQEQLKTPSQTAVITFVRLDKKTSPETIIFKGKDINAKKIVVSILSRLSGIKHLDVTNFQWEALTVKTTERFRPYIVAFYAWWADHADGFLSLLKSASKEFKSLSVMARFAIVNVAESKTVISRYIDLKQFKSIPFIAVFQRDKGKDTVNQTLVRVDHPSPFYLYQALQSKGISLNDAWGKVLDYSPYKVLDFTQYSDLHEGPWGDMCTAWASNQTDSDRPSPILKLKPQVKKIKLASLDKILPKVDGVPVISEALWDTVMGRSEVKFEKYSWQPDVKVTMLAFLREGCGSCRQKMQTFKQVYQELQKTDNRELYLVNCSKDARLCEHLEVQGYPSVMAFRSFVTLIRPGCEPPSFKKPYIRREYHGPISTYELLMWLKELTQTSLSVLAFADPQPLPDMAGDVRLVATVIPKLSQYLPLAPRHDRNYFYPLHCLRLACEHLYGLASCHVVYSKDIPQAEFKSRVNQEMVVTQIMFERKDSVYLKLMSLAKPLLGLLEEETASDLHLFHRPHNYALHPNQKCEEDHRACTEIVISYTRDHMRLPVTPLTSEVFHTKNSPLFDDGKPVLIALGHSDNITSTSDFMQMLHDVASYLYKDVTVTVMDVDLYPAWAGSFVPKNYYKFFADSDSAGPLHIYPRICLVDWQDHSHAAFYPPLQALFKNSNSTNNSLLKQLNSMYIDLEVESYTSFWERDAIVKYVKEYLSDPVRFRIKTEHF